MSFEDLPTELIEEIVKFSISLGTFRPLGAQYDNRTLCKLRLVSKRLDSLISPVLFSTLRLQASMRFYDFRAGSQRDRQVMNALATGRTCAFDHIRKLCCNLWELHYALGIKNETDKDEKEPLCQNGFSAMFSVMKNLQHVELAYIPGIDDEDFFAKVIHTLGSTQKLRGFTLEVLGNCSHLSKFSLQPLSNLHSITAILDYDEAPQERIVFEFAKLLARCPELKNVRFEGIGCSSLAPGLSDIFSEISKLDQPLRLESIQTCGIVVTPDIIELHARHLGKLKTLSLTRNPCGGAYTSGEICSVLGSKSIFLTEVSCEAIHCAVLLNYLSSYAGIENLWVEPRHPHDDLPSLVDRFYRLIVPKHRQSLSDLTIGSELESAWTRSPTKAQVNEITLCRNLRALQVKVTLTNKEVEEGRSMGLEMWLETAMRLPRLSCLNIDLALRPDDYVTESELSIARSRLFSQLISDFKEKRKPPFLLNA